MKLERIEEMINPQDMYLCRPMVEVVDVSDLGGLGRGGPQTNDQKGELNMRNDQIG